MLKLWKCRMQNGEAYILLRMWRGYSSTSGVLGRRTTETKFGLIILALLQRIQVNVSSEQELKNLHTALLSLD